MRRPRLTSTLLAVLAAVLLLGGAAAAIAAETTTWTRTASGEAAPESGLVRIPTDLGMLAAAGPSLESLRITRSGDTYPWRVLDPAEPAAPAGWQQATRLRGGVTSGRAVAEFEVPARSARYDATLLELTLPEQEGPDAFVATATLEGSSDQRTWYEFARGAVHAIDVQAAGAAPSSSSNMVIGFAPTEYRFMRVSVPGARDVRALSTSAAGASATERASAASSLRIESSGDARAPERGAESLLTFDARGSRMPLGAVELTVDQPVFERDYTVRTAATLDALEAAAPIRSGLVYRSSSTLEGVPGARTSIDLGPLFEHERFVQVRIDNGDDAPLVGLEGELLVPAPVVLAQLAPGIDRVRLTYGRSDRHAPDYEFARLPQPDDAAAAPQWELSQATSRRIELNPGEQEQRWLVNAIVLALGLFVIALAAYVLRRSRR